MEQGNQVGFAIRCLLGGVLAIFGLPALAGGTVAPEPWPQASSDLAPDPAAQYGVLPNGMRYVILPNHLPKGQVSLRLRIAAGSFQENEHQLGLAHFLEHMAFRGSTHVPDNEAFRILERFGAALGADSNAYTQQSETVYKIDLPKNSAAGIDTALMLMRETAGELSLTETAIEAERSVVLAEERAGDSPGARIGKDQRAFLFRNQPIGSHLPIGDVAVLKSAHAADLRAFYDAYYRPERATLVVTGDIQAAAIERKIKLRFTHWRGRGPAGADPDYGSPEKRRQEFGSRIEAGAPTFVTLAWTRPIDPRPDSKARERDWMIVSLGLQILNQRLDDMRLSANPPFLRAYASFQQLGRSAQMTALGLSTTEQGWRTGLEQVLKAWHALQANGVTQAELDRELANWRSRLENSAAASSTRRSSPLADELVGSLDSDTVFVTPATDLALFDALTPAATLSAVNAALRKSFTGNGPLVFLGGPQPMEGAEQILADAAKAATEPQKIEAQSAESWPYSKFGSPGAIAERHEEADLGVTLLRFANGVRLTVKPTNFHADQILISVGLGHGREDFSPITAAPLWAANSGAFLLGGYKDLAVPEIKRLMTGKQTGVAMSLGDSALRFSGATRPQDLTLQMQMMAAYLTDPGWRPEGLELVRSQLVNSFPQWQTNPGGVYAHHAGQLLRSGDPRWHAPDLAEVQALRYDELRQMIEPILQKAPIEIAMVGDITVDRAIAEVAATFGALPARDPEMPPPEANRHIAFPAATAQPIALHHKGRQDQGLAVGVWPTTDGLTDSHAPRVLRVLQLILQQRLTDEFRTKLGDSYSPGSEMDSSLDFPGYGFILAYAETPEAKMAAFDQTLASIARDLRETEVSMDEFERARRPRIETLLKGQQTNEYWLGTLQRAQTQPIWLEIVRTTISDLQRVTPAEVRALAETYLRDDHLWRLRVTPEPAKTMIEGEKG